MRSFSVILLCFLSFFVGCLFTSSFMSIDNNGSNAGVSALNSKVMKVHAAVKKSIRPPNDLIIVVVSAPSHYDRRQVIRETWAKDAKDNKFSYLFCIGTSGLKEELVSALKSEQLSNNDMILLPQVLEGYNLLTKKVLRTFEWLNKNIRDEHRLVLKCDDDSFVNVKELVKSPMLKSKDLLYWGYFSGRAPVHQRGKWKESEWNVCDHYIPYARGGGYILSRDLIKYLADNAEMFSAYQNEDVSVGLWLAPLNLTKHHDINFDTEFKSRGCNNNYIVTHPHSMSSMRNLHNSLQNTGKLCAKEETVRDAYTYNWKVPPTQCCQNVVKS